MPNVLQKLGKSVEKKNKLNLVGRDTFSQKNKISRNKIQIFCKQKFYMSLLSASTE